MIVAIVVNFQTWNRNVWKEVWACVRRWWKLLLRSWCGRQRFDCVVLVVAVVVLAMWFVVVVVAVWQRWWSKFDAVEGGGVACCCRVGC
jgi:hypothetical protein